MAANQFDSNSLEYEKEALVMQYPIDFFVAIF